VAGVSITGEPWGETDGQAVELYTLSSGGGLTVKVATYGGVVQSLVVPDRSGALRNVVLGFRGLEEYVANFTGVDGSASGATYFGPLVGRYANRIAGHAFTLDGERFELVGNNGPGDVNTIHGGPGAYSMHVWEAEPAAMGGGPALRLRYVDPDGKNGFPGTVSNEVTYAVTRDNALRIEYRATTDAPTVINLTNHSYFNLAGEGSGAVDGQLLAINGREILVGDAEAIPVGFASVAGTAFDFRLMKPIGRDLRCAEGWAGEQLALARGYDHNWVLAEAGGYRLVAVACDPDSGIALWTYTDQPGMQFYTANYLAGDLVGTGGRLYRQGDAFALETQHYPDAPNHIGEARWPSVVLRPGEVFSSQTTYRFTVAGADLAETVRFYAAR
jgi:aldose 1-epimerase